MSLLFPYQPEAIQGQLPPTLPGGTTHRFRPLVSVRIVNPISKRNWRYAKVLADSGSDDSIFPISAVGLIGLRSDQLLSTRFHVVWRGTAWPLQFGDVELELNDGQCLCRWLTRVAFSPMPTRFPILGQAGCLQFFNATFRGEDHITELEPIPTFPGTIS